MSREIAEEVSDLFDRRKYSSAMVLTSNRDVDEWGEVFPDPVLANATIDRIFDRAIIVTFHGQSYRLKGQMSLPAVTESNTPKSRRPKNAGVAEVSPERDRALKTNYGRFF